VPGCNEQVGPLSFHRPQAILFILPERRWITSEVCDAFPSPSGDSLHTAANVPKSSLVGLKVSIALRRFSSYCHNVTRLRRFESRQVSIALRRFSSYCRRMAELIEREVYRVSIALRRFSSYCL